MSLLCGHSFCEPCFGTWEGTLFSPFSLPAGMCADMEDEPQRNISRGLKPRESKEPTSVPTVQNVEVPTSDAGE